MQAGDPEAAVEVLAHARCWPKLLQVASGLALDEEPNVAAVQSAAQAFRAAGQTETARELHSRLGDHKVQLFQLAPLCETLGPLPSSQDACRAFLNNTFGH